MKKVRVLMKWILFIVIQFNILSKGNSNNPIIEYEHRFQTAEIFTPKMKYYSPKVSVLTPFPDTNSICLIENISDLNGQIDTPVRCATFINEFNSMTPNKDTVEFVEIKRVCKTTTGFKRYKLDNNLNCFKLVIIDPNINSIIFITNLNNQKMIELPDNTGNYFFTIGSSELDNKVQLKFENVEHISGSQTVNVLPNGEVTPLGLFLLKKSDQSSVDWNQLKLNKNDLNKYVPLVINNEIKTILSKYVIDGLTYGSTPLYEKCSIFESLIPGYTDSKRIFLNRDLQIENGQDFSINRCTSETSSFLTSSSFKYGNPTPSDDNKCEFRFSLESSQLGKILPQVTDQNEMVCENIINSNLNYASIHPKDQYNQMIVASNEARSIIQNVDVSPDFFENIPNEYSRLDERRRQITPDVIILPAYLDTSNFAIEWENNLRQHQADQIDIEVFLKEENKAFLKFNINNPPSNSTFYCGFCTDMLDSEVIVDRPGNIDKLSNKEGFLSTSQDPKRRNTQALNNHKKGNLHQLALKVLMSVSIVDANANLRNALFYQELPEIREYYKPTENIIKACYSAVKMNLPFKRFSELANLIESFDANLGHLYQNRYGCTEIIDFIGNVYHQSLVNYLLDKLPNFSIIVDESSDNSGKHFMIISFQSFANSMTPIMFFYKMVELGIDVTAQGLFNSIVNELEIDGLTSWFKSKISSYSSDTTNVMFGSLNSLFIKIRNYVEKPGLLGVKCQAHRLELAIKKTTKGYPRLHEIENEENQLYGFFEKSLKANAQLKEKIKELKDTDFELTYSFKIRWINSKFKIAHTIEKHYKSLMLTLDDISKDSRYPEKQKIRAEKLLTTFNNKDHLLSLLFVEDVAAILSEFSKKVQKTPSTPIGSYSLLVKVKSDITALKNTPGFFMNNFFLKCECHDEDVFKFGSNVTEVISGSVIEPEPFECTIFNFVNSKNVICKDVFIPPMPSEPGEIITTWYSDKRVEYINILINEMENYFPESYLFDFEIFFPPNLPSLGTTKKDYEIYKLYNFNNIFGWTRDPDLLKSDWIDFINTLKDDTRFFGLITSDALEFWPVFLSKPLEIKISNLIKLIFNDILAIPGSSASVEQYFSRMNYVKSDRRSLLTQKNLQNLLKIQIHGPSNIKEFNSYYYAKEWIKAGHSRSDDKTRRVTVLKENDENDPKSMAEPSIFP